VKYLLGVLLFLCAAIAQAEPLTPEPCGTGETAACYYSTGAVSLLTYNYVYGNVTVVVNGVEYTSMAPKNTTTINVTAVSGDGKSSVTVNALLSAVWVHAPGSRGSVAHWSLVSGGVN
jgi:hypothetical protein